MGHPYPSDDEGFVDVAVPLDVAQSVLQIIKSAELCNPEDMEAVKVFEWTVTQVASGSNP